MRAKVFALCCLLAAPAFGDAVISDIRMWHAPDRSRIVFDINQKPQFKVFTLNDPQRVVIDLQQTQIKAALPEPEKSGQFIERIRHGKPRAGTTRLVFDMKTPVRYLVLKLEPNEKYSHRLVVDFRHRDDVPPADTTPRQKPREVKEDFLVMIDPGHGGEDPGALGKRIREKDLVLEVAQRLQKHINRKPGMRAALTRKGDYYIPLRGRTHIARKQNADVFISVHADAFKNPRARGASVYALSQRGASSETARWLADKENAADLAGGVNLADADRHRYLPETLVDMSMDKSLEMSIILGRAVLDELKKIGKVHSERVELAGFVVLKSPDIPSILLETGYITNRTEEKLLSTATHQEKIAAAVANGLAQHLSAQRAYYANE